MHYYFLIYNVYDCFSKIKLNRQLVKIMHGLVQEKANRIICMPSKDSD